jgi:hypothetical protein
MSKRELRRGFEILSSGMRRSDISTNLRVKRNQSKTDRSSLQGRANGRIGKQGKATKKYEATEEETELYHREWTNRIRLQY